MSQRAAANERLKVWQWDDPVYGVPVVLLRGPYERFKRWTIHRYGAHVEFDEMWERTPAARCLWSAVPGGSWSETALWFPSNLKPFTALGAAAIAHEALHATHNVMDHVGVKLTDASEEAFAYYLGWLVREMTGRLAAR